MERDEALAAARRLGGGHASLGDRVRLGTWLMDKIFNSECSTSQTLRDLEDVFRAAGENGN